MNKFTFNKPLNNKPRLPARHRASLMHRQPSGGFSMTEALVAVAAGALIIGAGALALRSTQTLIKGSGEKATQRQNTTNGLRLMRSGIERSQFVLVHNQEDAPSELEFTDLDGYADEIAQCRKLAAGLAPDATLTANDKAKFLPLFGTKMIDVETPVIYGLGVGSNHSVYAIKRCGTPLGLDGSYLEDQSPFIATVIDGIGMMNYCVKAANSEECNKPQKPTYLDSDNENESNDVLRAEDGLRHLQQAEATNNYATFAVKTADQKTPQRSYLEPALRIETDENRKLVKFVSPKPCGASQSNAECVENSLVEVLSASRSISSQPLLLTAFARADKRPIEADGVGGVIGGDWFRNVTSSKVRFLVDGSGSMSRCMAWSYDQNGNIEEGNTERKFYTPPGDPMRSGSNIFAETTAICNETRMERLQRELISILNQLPEDTMISIESFSTPNRLNNKQWSLSTNGLVNLGDGENRASAITFVESLNNGDPEDWGGTNPWSGLNRAFDDSEADTLYFLSDGQPTIAPSGFWRWKNQGYMPAATYYSAINDDRATPLKVNTTAVELSSPWMEELSEATSGNHLQSQ